ncbi:MXAN_6577-like cysteine-rich protein [Sorangium sp. So ce1036]|uniref:MXAN_6577-like cysteine-rich protein n=1 Tax=Sorangium sp. So ce1036 TaxID=3133328 RepID=UPI003F04977B
MNQPGLRSRLERSPAAPWAIASLVLASAASCARGDNTLAACDDDLSLCGGACVDTQTDPEHCGACDGVCADGQHCEAGACVGEGGATGAGSASASGGVDVPTCGAGEAECDGGCVDLQSSPVHCGRCGVQCAPDETCTEGACRCNEGLTACVAAGASRACVDLSSDPLHCGGCGAACAPGLSCHAGACTCLGGPREDLGSTVPQGVTGTTVGADTRLELACGGTGSAARIYRFTAPEAGLYRFDTRGSSYDTVLGVLGADACDVLACNDDLGGREARASVELDEGEAVFVVVSGYDGEQGDFSLRIGREAPPVCPTGTLEPDAPQTIRGDTTWLSDAVAPHCGASGSSDASYTFTAPRDGRYVFDTFGSSFDTLLELRSETCAGSVIVCNNDAAGGKQSRVAADLAAGQTVVAVVDGNAGDAGAFTLSVTEYVAPPCPEHDLGSAVPQRVTGNSAAEARESALSSPCGGGDGPEVTYSFTAPERALYTFDTFGSSFDTVLYLHDGTCDGPSLGCDDDTSDAQSQVRVLLDEGQTVVVVVDGYGSSSSGPFSLGVSQTQVPSCPLIDLGSTVPQAVTGTTEGAVDMLDPSCGEGGGGEATYGFTAPAAGTYVFDTFGSSFDTVLHARDGGCAGPQLGCNDDAGGGQQSQLVMELEAHQTILLAVDGSSAVESGEFMLTVERVSDEGTCATAIDLGSTVPQTAEGRTTARPNTHDTSCDDDAAAPDVVYTFTAPEDGYYVVDTVGSAFDTIVQVREGSCAGDALACNDDAGGSQSAVNVPLRAGQTVAVIVDGYSMEEGSYTLNITPFEEIGTCAAPIDLGSELPLTRTGASVIQPDSMASECVSVDGPDTVFTYTAPVAGTYVIDAIGEDFDTVLHARSGGCDGAPLACNDDDPGTAAARLRLELTAGQVITLVVDSYGSKPGNFTLHIDAY